MKFAGVRVLVLVFFSTVAMAAAPVAELEQLVADEQYERAYALASELESQQAGNPRFDFLYGMAAYHTGHLDRAVLAFERVVLVEPANLRARLELARAQFDTGDYAGARRGFERVLAANPPPIVQARIRGFIEAIDRREKALGTQTQASLTLWAGHDTNINSATSAEEVNVLGLPFRLADDSREIESGYAELQGGWTLSHPINKREAYFATANLQHRANFETHDFDLTALTLGGGFAAGDQNSRWRFPMQVQGLYLAGDLTRVLTTGGADWTTVINSQTDFTVFGQVGMSKYPDAAARDATITLIGTGLNYRVSDSGTILSAAASLGRENADVNWHGRDIATLRLAAYQPLSARQSVNASLMAQHATHHDEMVLFGETREDSLLDLRVEWTYRLAPNWALLASASASRNDSNLVLYDYDRQQVQVGIRYLTN